MSNQLLLENHHPTILFLKLCVFDNELKERFLSNPLKVFGEYGLLEVHDEALNTFNLFPFLLDFPYNPEQCSELNCEWSSYISYLRGVTLSTFNFDYFASLVKNNIDFSIENLKHKISSNKDFFKQQIKHNIISFETNRRKDRKFHLINIGMAKCGSTTASALFANYRSIHEGLHEESVEKVLDFKESILSENELNKFLLRRDQILRPEFDGATFFHLIPQQVFKCFPNAKFLLICRDVGSWILSSLTRLIKIVNGTRQTNESQTWYQRYAKLVFPEQINWWSLFQNSSETNISLMPLIDNFAKVWMQSIVSVIKTIPPERLFLIKLNNLSNQQTIIELCKFTGIDYKTINSHCNHMNKEDLETLNNVKEQFGLQKMDEITKHYDDMVSQELQDLHYISR